jgi:hypothetical protein
MHIDSDFCLYSKVILLDEGGSSHCQLIATIAEIHMLLAQGIFMCKIALVDFQVLLNTLHQTQ